MQVTGLPDLNKVAPGLEAVDYKTVKDSLQGKNTIKALDHLVEMNMSGVLPLKKDLYEEDIVETLNYIARRRVDLGNGRPQRIVVGIPVLRIAKEYRTSGEYCSFEMPPSLKHIESYMKRFFVGRNGKTLNWEDMDPESTRYPSCLLANVKIGNTPAFSSIFSYSRNK